MPIIYRHDPPCNLYCLITDVVYRDNNPFSIDFIERKGVPYFLLTIVDNPDGLLCFHSNVIDSVGKDGGMIEPVT